MKAVIGLLIALAAALLVTTVPHVDEPLGPSHDGRNAAQWALASDGVEQHGLVGSRLGAIHADGSVYANHPPMTGLTTAASIAAFGRDETGVRLPGLLAALATIPLLWLVLWRLLPISRHAAAVGCVIALATPMFFGFGSMIDSPPLSFPIGLAVVAIWRSPARREWVLALAAALAVLAGWQAALLVAVLVGAEGFGAWRERRRPGWGLPTGFATGLAGLAAWLLWVHGSVGPMIATLTYRSGNADYPVGLGDSIRAQAEYLELGFPLLTLAVAAAGCVVAVRRAATRRVAIVALVVVSAYSLLLRQAAYFHAYWNYWALLPVAIGLGTIAAEVLSLRSLRPAVRAAVLRGSTVVALLTIAIAVASPPHARVEARDGYAASGPLRSRTLPPAQDTLWLMGDFDSPPSWVEFYARRRVMPLTSPRRLERLQREHPDHLVFIAPACQGSPVCAVTHHAFASGHYRLVRAWQLDQDVARG